MSAVRVAVFPRPGGDNPYGRLLGEALERQGVEHVDAGAFSARWLRDGAEGVDAVHLHWIEYLYNAGGRRPLRDAVALRRAARLVDALRTARRRPVRVVWTVHNLRPHEARHPWLDGRAARTAAGAADALIVHSEHAAARVCEHLAPAAPITVLPHPNYLGAYPEAAAGRAAERVRLGLPADAFVYLVFGQVRRYKRVPEVVRAFRSGAAADARLVVAGAVVEEALRHEIVAARGDDERVLLRLGAVPEAEVAGLHRAADAAVLHYRDVFSSGALMLALSFGLPVAGPAGTTLTELCRREAIVPYAPGGLEQALAGLREGDPRRRAAAALATAKTYNWDDYAAGVAALYRGEAATSLRRAAA